MASKDSANNRGQGVRTGSKVSLDTYSDSSSNKGQGIKRGPKAASLDKMSDSANHKGQAIGSVRRV